MQEIKSEYLFTEQEFLMALCNGLCALARKLTGEEMVLTIGSQKTGQTFYLREENVVTWEKDHRDKQEEA